MTPPAATDAGHRQKLRPKRAAAIPRRVSGPAPARTQPRAPAPARTRPRGRRPPREAAHKGSLSLRVLGFVRALPDQPLLDRLVRGRSWIPVLGILLAGIVAMQVEVLKLGASIGRSINAGTALESRNQLLRASVAGLADQQRIERLAAGMGMVMPLPGEVGFLAAPSGADAVHAANDIHAPDATSFLAALTASATNLTSGPAGQTAAAVPTPPGTATAASAAATSPTSAAQTQPAPTSQTGGAGQPTATGAVSPTVGGSAGSTSVASPAQTPVTPASGAPVQPAPPAQRTSSGGATPAGG